MASISFVEFLAFHDVELLFEQCSVQAFDEPVGLGHSDLGGSPLDLL